MDFEKFAFRPVEYIRSLPQSTSTYMTVVTKEHAPFIQQDNAKVQRLYCVHVRMDRNGVVFDNAIIIILYNVE